MTCFRLEDGRTVHKWCVDNEIPYHYFWQRIERGMSFDEAFNDCVARKKRIKAGTRLFFIYNNILYDGFFVKEDGNYYILRKQISRKRKIFRVLKEQVATKVSEV